MAEATNGLQQMAVTMMNPQFAAQQQKFALQQAMAQQMMEQGAQQPPNAQLANPGGMVIKNSPLGGAARGIQQALGAYMANKNIDNQIQSYKDMAQNSGPSDPNSMNNTELLHNAMSTGSGTAEYNHRLAMQMAADEARGKATNTPIIDPNGVPYYPKPNPLAASPAPTPAPLQSQLPPQSGTVSPPIPVTSANLPPPQTSPQQDAALSNAIGGGPVPPVGAMPAPVTPGANPSVMSPRGNGGPVNLGNQQTDSAPKIIMAGDGIPLIENQGKFKADPTGIPKYNTPNTTVGVDLAKGMGTADLKADADITAQQQSLSNEGFRIDQLAKIYRDVQAGTLTAQNPEYFNKLAALGIASSPEQIKQLGGVQAAMPNHLYQVINQYKDINTPMGENGGRLFGAVINKLTDEGENAKMQPAALQNLLTQAKAQVNRATDMAQSWTAQGGLGNRNAAGFTERPTEHMQNFMTKHPLEGYLPSADKQVGVFKGMPGNNGVVDVSSYKTPQDVGEAYKAGKLTKAQAIDALQKNHGMVP